METKRHIYNIRIITLLLLMMIGWGSVNAEEVKYEITSTSGIKTIGTAPTGSLAVFDTTGSLYSGSIRLTKGDTANLTLSGFSGYKITGIKLLVKSNTSTGKGSFTAIAGNDTIAAIPNSAFNTINWNGAWSTSLVTKTVSMIDSSHKVTDGEDVVLKIKATDNSLYINEYDITYEKVEGLTVPKVSLISGTYKGSQNSTITVPSDSEVDAVLYTLDGSDPKTSHESNVINASTDIIISSSCTFRAVSTNLDRSLFSDEITRDYIIKDDASLVSISISGNYQTLFRRNRPFNYDDAIITATYSNGSTEDVTDKVSFSQPDMTTEGEKKITITYFEDTESVTTYYNINVVNNCIPAKEGYETVDFTELPYYSTLKSGTAEVVPYSGNSFDMTFAKPQSSSNKTTYYVNGNSVHSYIGNTISITAAEDIKYVRVNFVTGYVDNGATILYDGKSAIVTFSKICHFTSITVYYSSLTIPIAAACTDGTRCYSTYSSSKAFFVPENLTVSEIGITDGRLNVQPYATGAVVPANTGLMVSATEGGNYSVAIASDATDATSVLGINNCLKPTGDSGISADQMNTGTASDALFYRLTMHNGTQIGYWWGAENGAAFAIAANKAYLEVPQSASVKTSMWFDSDVTSISPLLTNLPGNATYNLSGQRITDTSKKGIYIMNGKKYVAK